MSLFVQYTVQYCTVYVTVDINTEMMHVRAHTTFIALSEEYIRYGDGQTSRTNRTEFFFLRGRRGREDSKRGESL